MEAAQVFSEDEKEQIYYKNAEQLFGSSSNIYL